MYETAEIGMLRQAIPQGVGVSGAFASPDFKATNTPVGPLIGRVVQLENREMAKNEQDNKTFQMILDRLNRLEAALGI